MDIRKSFDQFLKFGIVGVMNTGASLLIYYLLVYLGVAYLIANAVAFVLTVINSYFWNSRYVFKNRKAGHIAALAKTYASYGVTLVLSMLLLYLMIDVAGLSKYVAPVLTLFVTVPTNFVIVKYFAMNER